MLKPVGLVISPSNPCGKNTPLPSGLPRVTMLMICVDHSVSAVSPLLHQHRMVMHWRHTDCLHTPQRQLQVCH